MLDLAVLFILAIGFLIGLKRGFILQLIHLTGFIIAFTVAYFNYEKLAPKLTLWVPYPSFNSSSTLDYVFDNANLEDAYYRAIAFVVIFFAVKILLQMVGSMLDFVAQIPILKQLNVWAGGMLGFTEVYLIMFIILFIAALIPMSSIQGPLTDSVLAEFMVKHTPFLSMAVQDLWMEYSAK
jgi:uncharacterized membrane protein required for colicin V production